MKAFAFALAFALAGADPAPNAVAVVEGDAAPFTGVLVTNDRAAELALAEAEAKATKKQLEHDAEVREAWKAMALEKQDVGEAIFTPGTMLVVGVVVGVAVSVGMFLLAGSTIGVARAASTP